MKAKLLTLVIAITLTNPVLAANSFGAADCGQWITGQSRTTPHQADRAWLLGFISGINQDEYYKNALNKISSAHQIFLWMDNFCKTNPLERVSDGVYRLMNELMKK